jgi:cobalt transporter subunit CbtB
MTSQVSNQVQVKSTTSVLAQNIAALLFGIIILSAVGFAPMDVVHSAAHDTRHALAFPCH